MNVILDRNIQPSNIKCLNFTCILLKFQNMQISSVKDKLNIKRYLLSTYKRKIAVLRQKLRFSEAILQQKNSFSQILDDLQAWLQANNYLKAQNLPQIQSHLPKIQESGYSYLSSMTLQDLNSFSRQRYAKQIKQLQEQVKELDKKSQNQMLLQDLSRLEQPWLYKSNLKNETTIISTEFKSFQDTNNAGLQKTHTETKTKAYTKQSPFSRNNNRNHFYQVLDQPQKRIKVSLNSQIPLVMQSSKPKFQINQQNIHNSTLQYPNRIKQTPIAAPKRKTYTRRKADDDGIDPYLRPPADIQSLSKEYDLQNDKTQLKIMIEKERLKQFWEKQKRKIKKKSGPYALDLDKPVSVGQPQQYFIED